MEQKKMVSMRLNYATLDLCRSDFEKHTGIKATKTEIVELALDILWDCLDDLDFGTDLQKQSSLLMLYKWTKAPAIKEMIEEGKKRILDQAK